MISEPYKSVELLPFDDHGWFLPENRRNLEKIIIKQSPKCVVELGSWLGKSTRFMASLLPDDAKLYAVDTWLGSSEHASLAYRQKLPTLYQQFLSNIIHAKLTHLIIPMQMMTRQAVHHIDDDIDLVYIDASHAEKDVYDDIMDWYPKLSKDGIICGDDYANDHPGVIAAANRTSKELGMKLCNDKRFWWFEL